MWNTVSCLLENYPIVQRNGLSKTWGFTAGNYQYGLEQSIINQIVLNWKKWPLLYYTGSILKSYWYLVVCSILQKTTIYYFYWTIPAVKHKLTALALFLILLRSMRLYQVFHCLQEMVCIFSTYEVVNEFKGAFFLAVTTAPAAWRFWEISWFDRGTYV